MSEDFENIKKDLNIPSKYCTPTSQYSSSKSIPALAKRIRDYRNGAFTTFDFDKELEDLLTAIGV